MNIKGTPFFLSEWIKEQDVVYAFKRFYSIEVPGKQANFRLVKYKNFIDIISQTTVIKLSSVISINLVKNIYSLKKVVIDCGEGRNTILWLNDGIEWISIINNISKFAVILFVFHEDKIKECMEFQKS